MKFEVEVSNPYPATDEVIIVIIVVIIVMIVVVVVVVVVVMLAAIIMAIIVVVIVVIIIVPVFMPRPVRESPMQFIDTGLRASKRVCEQTHAFETYCRSIVVFNQGPHMYIYIYTQLISMYIQ